jgi:predicted DNA-binding transcriptional regulator AlpA
MSEWLTVGEYAKRVGKSRQQIYLDIRLGKIPQEKVRQIKIKEIFEIEYD